MVHGSLILNDSSHFHFFPMSIYVKGTSLKNQFLQRQKNILALLFYNVFIDDWDNFRSPCLIFSTFFECACIGDISIRIRIVYSNRPRFSINYRIYRGIFEPHSHRLIILWFQIKALVTIDDNSSSDIFH